MPRSIRPSSLARAAVFAPLDGVGRAERVAERLTAAIALGVLADGERLPKESELARQFGVATMTAREALEALRDKGLLRTTRGREGGSFVTAAGIAAEHLLNARVLSLSRVELRDVSTYYCAITAGAAELAADRTSADDVENLRRVVERTDFDDPGAARRGEGAFHLELAALSQSARLVREEIRLQAEFGPLLWLSLREDGPRCAGRSAHLRIIEAIQRYDSDGARKLTAAHLAEALEWLVEHKARLDGDE